MPVMVRLPSVEATAEDAATVKPMPEVDWPVMLALPVDEKLVAMVVPTPDVELPVKVKVPAVDLNVDPEAIVTPAPAPARPVTLVLPVDVTLLSEKPAADPPEIPVSAMLPPAEALRVRLVLAEVPIPIELPDALRV